MLLNNPLNTDVYSVFDLLHRVNMGDVADILAARADSIFNVKVF
jgi:hypothetical protein